MSRGYTAPEYALHGHLSEKVDTYSFGIVVLETVSGRKSNNVEVEATGTGEYLLEQAWKLHEIDMHLKLVDETLVASDYDNEQARRVIKIALLCTQSQPGPRPTMSEVVVMLSSDTSADHAITIRSFDDPDRRRFFYADPSLASGTQTSSSSNATASFTDFLGR